MRVCTKCGVSKPSEEYYTEKRAVDGLKAWCKVCHNKIVSANYKKRYVPRPRVYTKQTAEERKLTKKNYVKNMSPEKLKALRAWQKQYREQKSEEAKEYKRVWHLQHKERLNKKSIEYSKNNKERRKEYLKEYLPTRRKLRKERSETDVLYKVRVNLRNCITRAFKLRQGWGKLGKSEKIIGCSYELAIKYLERQFTEGMTWDNHGAGHGKWNIDHQIPLASAKTAEEVKVLCHYSNLQPLWFIDNVRKQDKIPSVQLKIPI